MNAGHHFNKAEDFVMTAIESAAKKVIETAKGQNGRVSTVKAILGSVNAYK